MNEDLTLKCTVCTVLVTSATNGLALVYNGTGELPNMGKVLVAYLPIADVGKGGSYMNAPSPGSHVLCAIDPYIQGRCYIIGPANWVDMPAINVAGAQGTRVYNYDQVPAGKQDTVFNAIKDMIASVENGIFALSPRGRNVDIDAIAGDVCIRDASGNTELLISRLLATLRGSPLAYIEVSPIGDSVLALGRRVETKTLGHEHIASDDLVVSNTALSVSEVLGTRRGLKSAEINEDVKIDNGPNDPKTGQPQGELKTVTKHTLPLYRLQNMEGSPVAGRESIVVGFPLKGSDGGADNTVGEALEQQVMSVAYKDTLDTHTDKTEPPVLSRRRDSLSGELSDASAYGISSVKTPVISAILQKGYDAEVVEELKEYEEESAELRRAYKAESVETPIDEHSRDERTRDEAINKLMDKMLSSDYVDKLVNKLAERGLKISSAEKGVCGIKGVFTQPGGTCTTQMYGLPDAFSIDDPVTGNSRLYYSSASFISQEPNGDILISDGYGSEIRMSRGNIYISPALDLQVRPGRDMSVMAGRHQAYNSQESCTINTSGSMHIKSDKDMRIAGVMGSEDAVNTAACVMTIESGASKDEGGIVIRSKSTTNIYGNSINIARNRETDDKDGNPVYSKANGAIVLDSGPGGSISSKCGYYSAIAASEVDIVAGESGGRDTSFITLLPSGKLEAAKSCTLLSDTVLMGAWQSSSTIDKAIGTGATEQIEVGVDVISENQNEATTKNCNLIVDGTIVIGKSCKINETLTVCKAGISKSFATSTGTVGRTRAPSYDKDGNKVNDVFEPMELEYETDFQLGANAANLSAASSGWAYDYMSRHRFWFPDYGIGTPWKIPGMRWQAWYTLPAEQQRGAADGSKWRELPIKDSNDKNTYVYPGMETWENGVITYPGYIEKNLNNEGYVINTIKKEDRK